jgi:hypothetical protein
VAWLDDGEVLVGRPAARQAALNPAGTVYGAKRLIGRKFDDPRIKRWQELVHYGIVKASRSRPRARLCLRWPAKQRAYSRWASESQSDDPIPDCQRYRFAAT